MKLALLSDPHLLIHKPKARLDDAIATAFKKMNFVLKYCKDNNANLIIAGDLTDKPRSWNLLPRVLDLFSNYSDVKVFAVFGQHDMYLYSEETRDKTILGALYNAGLVELLSSKPISLSNVELYGCNYGEKVPKIIDKKKKNILVIHAPIAEKALYTKHDYISARSFLKDNKDYKIIFCGDIHVGFCLGDRTGRTILNTGPMIRKTADKYNFIHEPCFYTYDTVTDDIRMIEIPHRPAEEVLSREHLVDEEDKKVLRSKFTESLSKEIEIDMSFTSNLEALLRRNMRIRKGIRNVIAKELSIIEEGGVV